MMKCRPNLFSHYWGIYIKTTCLSISYQNGKALKIR